MRAVAPTGTAFGLSEPYTVGVEEEFQIVDPGTGDLVSRADEVLGKADPGRVENLKSEIFQSVIETATDVCADVDAVAEEMATLRGVLFDALEDRGYAIAAAGTHPFARWEDQDVTEQERYRELVEELRWVVKRELIFGQHVHVGLQSREQAIYVLNGIRPFLPLILALSVNSPFWRGDATGLLSTRLRIFDALPRTGLPRRFADWDDFEDTLTKLKAGGSIEDITKLWWDVRPRDDLGTVEVRIADLPTTVDESVALAAFTVAFVAALARRHDRGEPIPFDPEREVVEENRWRALRDGLDAEFIRWRVEDPAEDEVEEVPCQAMFDYALELLEDTADELALTDRMDLLRRTVASGRSGADRQLELYEKTGTMAGVVRELVELTRP